jgi:hypothetical protein
MQSLESKKHDLAYKAVVRNLTTLTQTEQEGLRQGLMEVPVYKIYQHAQYVQNQLLPRIEKSKGIASDEYLHFKGIHDTLIWCIHVMDLQERILYQYSNEKLLSEFYREKCIFYERELQRHTTREELLMGETNRACAQAIVRGSMNRMHSAAIPVPATDENPITEPEDTPL